MSIFMDTGIFFGAYNEGDALHEDALAIYVAAFGGKWGGVYTSDYVVDETCTLLKLHARSDLAVRFLKAVKESMGISLVRVEEELFDTSCGIFEEYLGRKGITFTDAATIAIMRALDIEVLASFNAAFDGIAPRRIGEGYASASPKDARSKAESAALGGLR